MTAGDHDARGPKLLPVDGDTGGAPVLDEDPGDAALPDADTAALAGAAQRAGEQPSVDAPGGTGQ